MKTKQIRTKPGERITIPKTFRSADKTVTVELKSKITGDMDNRTGLFHGSYPVFDLPFSEEEVTPRLLENAIIDIYYRGIKNRAYLSASELIVFYHIKDVRSKVKAANKTLVIGYDNLTEIKNTIMQFDTNCECFDIDKNLEIYLQKDFDNLMITLEKKLKKGKYNTFVFDTGNVFINSDYKKTLKFVELVESTGGRVLFLVQNLCSAESRFIRIYGMNRFKNVIDKNRYLSPTQNRSLYTIKTILFD